MHLVSSAPGPNYSVKYYKQKLDHFNAADDRHWKQRYLVNQDNWDGEGPILLYTGNEGDITWFCNNTVCGKGGGGGICGRGGGGGVCGGGCIWEERERGDVGINSLLFFPQGFIFDLSAELHALVIFIEHRYYGESLPFGPASYQDKHHLGYLTSEQALADFAVLITEVKVRTLPYCGMCRGCVCVGVYLQYL